MNRSKLPLVAVIVVLLGLFYLLGLDQYLTLEAFKSRQAGLGAWHQQHRVEMIAIYFIAYVLVAGLSIPGAALMTLADGALFGLCTGVLIISLPAPSAPPSPFWPRATCCANQYRTALAGNWN